MHIVHALDPVVGEVKTTILPPAYQSIIGSPGSPGGLVLFFTNVIRLFFVGAGVWAFVNLLIGGMQFMSAGGDAKAVSAAWNRIWQSLLGLIIIVGSFALASVFGYVLFGQADFILNPKIYGPTQTK